MLVLILSISFFGSVNAQSIACPENVLSELDLVNIVEAARVSSNDLPVKFSNYHTKVARLRCLYILYEIETSESSEIYQTFTIDPYGELMEYYVNKEK